MQSSKDRDGLSRSDRVYRPIVEYTYTVGGHSFGGNRIHRHEATRGRNAAQRELGKYPPKKTVIVLYDPNEPETAYLETRTSIGGVILCAFGGFWIALGGLLAELSFL